MARNRLAFGAIIGAAVGVVAGVLTAPKSGKETRDDIKSKALDLKDQAGTARDQIVGKVEDTALDVKDKATSAADNLKSSFRGKK